MENRGNTVLKTKGKKKGRGASAKLEKQRKKEEMRAKMLEARAKANAEYLIIKTDDERPETVCHKVARPALTTEQKIEKDLKAISLNSIIRQAKTTSAGYDNAITAYNELNAQNAEIEKLIKECRAPKGSDDAVKEEFKAKRNELKKAQKEIMRKADVAYEKAIALERSADEYSYIEALLSNEPEKNYRKEARVNAKSIDLTKEEELELIERYLSGGKKKKKVEIPQEEFDVIKEEVKTLKILGYEKPKAPETKTESAPIESNAKAEVEIKPAPKAKKAEEPKASAMPEEKAKAVAAPEAIKEASQPKSEEKKVSPKAPKASKDKKCPCRKKGIALLFALAAIVIILLVSLVKCGKEDEAEVAPVVVEIPVVETPAEVINAEEEAAKAAAEAEALLKAEEEAKAAAEAEALLKAEEEARIKAEEEEARLKAEEEARVKAEEEARVKAEEEAQMISSYWDIYGEIAYGGYSFDLEIGRGSTKVFFDEKTISESDVEMFIASVAGKYASYLDGVVYDIEDGVLFVDYPFIINEDDQLFIFDTLNAEAVSLIKSFQVVEEEENEVVEEVQAIVEDAEEVQIIAEVEESVELFNEEVEPYVAIEAVVEEAPAKEKKLTITSYPMGSTKGAANASEPAKSAETEKTTEKKLTITSYPMYPTESTSNTKESAVETETKEKTLTITSYPISSSKPVEEETKSAEKSENKLTITHYTIYPRGTSKSQQDAAEIVDSEKKLTITSYPMNMDSDENVVFVSDWYKSDDPVETSEKKLTITFYPMDMNSDEDVVYASDWYKSDDAALETENKLTITFYPMSMDSDEDVVYASDWYKSDDASLEAEKKLTITSHPMMMESDENVVYVSDWYKSEETVETAEKKLTITHYTIYPREAYSSEFATVEEKVEEVGTDPIIDEPIIEPEVVETVEAVVEEVAAVEVAEAATEAPEATVEEVVVEEKIEEAEAVVSEETPKAETVVAEETPKTESVVAEAKEEVVPVEVAISFDVVLENKKYEPSFNILLTGGVATDVSLAPEFVLDGTYPRVGLALEFQNILSASWFGVGLRSDISTVLMPRDKNWANMPTSFNDVLAGDIYVDASADIKLMSYFGNESFDFYLGGGVGYSVFYPQLGASAADYGHSFGSMGMFDSAWFLSGNAGIRFMLNDTLSIGTELNYRYLMPAEKHSVSADITFGISF